MCIYTVHFYVILQLMWTFASFSYFWGEVERHDSCFRNQECRLGSSSVRLILCDHIVMSQGHEILPGIVAHLCWVRERLQYLSWGHSRMITVLGMTQANQDDALQGKVHPTIYWTFVLIMREKCKGKIQECQPKVSFHLIIKIIYWIKS